MNLIKANKDQTVLIKEIDKYCIHVRLKRVAVDPADPVNKQSSDFRIQIFSAQEWESMQKRHSYPDEWVKIGGYVSAVVVHDGRLEPKEEDEKQPVVDHVKDVVNAEVEKELLARQEKKRRVKNMAANLNSQNKAK